MKIKLHKFVSVVLAVIILTAVFPVASVQASDEVQPAQSPPEIKTIPVLFGYWLADITEEYTDIHLWYKIQDLPYTYDNNGNQTAASSTTYAWDYNNRLTQVIVPGAATATITSAYDPSGQRIKYTVATGSSITTYYPTKLYNTDGTTLTKHIFAGSELVTTISGQVSSSAVVELYSTSLYSDSDLKGYYRLENANDSKNTYHLTSHDSPAFSSAKFNNGLNLGTNNSTKYLDIADSLGINGGNISFSAWVKLNAEPGNNIDYTFVNQTDSTADVRYTLIYGYSSGNYHLYFIRHKGTDQYADYVVSGGLGTVDWHHLAGTYDGTYLRLYLDGELVAGPIAASGNGTYQTNSFNIGNARNADSQIYHSNAVIDDVAVFARALTGEEIDNLVNGDWPNTSFATYSIITDHLSGSNLVIDEEGSVQELVDYLPYGEMRFDQQTGFNEQRKFTGQEYDAATELSYLNARYYNGSNARFISQDPAFINLSHLEVQLADPQSWNSYAYGRNNPLRYIDPNGKWFAEALSWVNARTGIGQAVDSSPAYNYAVEHPVQGGIAVAAVTAAALVAVPAASTIGSYLTSAPALTGAGINISGQILQDLTAGEFSGVGAYTVSALSGAAGGSIKGGIVVQGVIGAGSNYLQQKASDKSPVDWTSVAISGASSAVSSKVMGSKSLRGLSPLNQSIGQSVLGGVIETPAQVIHVGTQRPPGFVGPIRPPREEEEGGEK